MSRAILTLQGERFFEGLTAKFWNHSAKGYCENSDDSEGITLESLGGVFIATLFGLALAMLTLIGEVIYYRRKEHRNNVVMITPAHTPPTASIEDTIAADMLKMDNRVANQIAYGHEYGSVTKKSPNSVSFIKVYPRKSIHSVSTFE